MVRTLGVVPWGSVASFEEPFGGDVAPYKGYIIAALGYPC